MASVRKQRGKRLTVVPAVTHAPAPEKDALAACNLTHTVKIKPRQGNHRSRKIILCGARDSCQGQRHALPQVLALCRRGEPTQTGGEQGGAQPTGAARGASGGVPGAPAPELSVSRGHRRGWGPMSLKTDLSFKDLCGSWTGARRPETARDSGRGGGGGGSRGAEGACTRVRSCALGGVRRGTASRATP